MGSHQLAIRCIEYINAYRRCEVDQFRFKNLKKQEFRIINTTKKNIPADSTLAALFRLPNC